MEGAYRECIAAESCRVSGLHTFSESATITLFSFSKTGSATVRIDVLEDPLSVVVTFIDNGKAYDPLARKDPDVALTAEGFHRAIQLC